VAHEAGLADREADEHPDRVERHQFVDTRPDSEEQRERRDGEHDDAVAEREPMSPAGQLPR